MQIPQRKEKTKIFGNVPNNGKNDDTQSVFSGMSQYSDISIDPVIRQKAERILESNPKTSNTLDVIKEESGAQVSKLTLDKLKTLDNTANKLGIEADKLSHASRLSR